MREKLKKVIQMQCATPMVLNSITTADKPIIKHLLPVAEGVFDIRKIRSIGVMNS